jgi:ribosomal protein S27E
MEKEKPMTKKNEKDVETKAETHVETVSETPPETPEEGVLSASIINKVFHQRMKEAMSLREIAEENGLSLSTVQRMLEGIEVENLQEPSHQEAKSIVAPSPIPQEEIEPTQIPDGYTLTPAATPEEYQKFAKMDKSALVSEVVNLKAANRSLQTRAILRKGDGEPSSDGYGSENRELAKQKARIFKIYGDWMEQQTIENMAEKMRNPKGATEKENTLEKFLLEIVTKTVLNQKGEQLSMKDTLELAKFLGGSNIKEIMQIVDYITQARNQGQNVTLNDIALKLEELKQNAALEDKKLNWEMQKWQRQEEKGDQTMELIKEGLKTVSSGAVGDFVRDLGGAAAARVRGGPKVPMAKVRCPQCSTPFQVNANLAQVQCPGCGAMLQKQPGAEPQPQPNPIPETQPPPQETRNETVVTNIQDLNKKPESEVI